MRGLSYATLTSLLIATWGCETQSQTNLGIVTAQKDDSVQQPKEALEETEPAWNFSAYFQAHRNLLVRNSFDWDEFAYDESDWGGANWSLATEDLEKFGDHFTLHLIEFRLEMLYDQDQVNQVQVDQLRQLSDRIKQKLNTPACSKENLQFLLERVAYADMMCPEIERSLIVWTRSQIRALDQSTDIREELERIRASYEFKQTELEPDISEFYDLLGLDIQYFNKSMEDRVKWEAKFLLKSQDNSLKN